jgi:hypothetical protein
MKDFIQNIILFLIPILTITFIVIFIDPFNLIWSNQVFRDDIKKEISLKINHPLYKLIQFKKNPTDVIILGDSRAAHLASKNFEDKLNLKTTNLGYGGGTLLEIIETFWFASDLANLKKVYIGISFNNYNRIINNNRVSNAKKLIDSKISYLFSKYTIKATYLILKSFMQEKIINIEKPPFDKEGFWKYQLEVASSGFYRNYIYPTSEYEELKKIAKFSYENSIELIFFIPPTHIDLQNKIIDYSLQKENKKFKEDLSKIGMVFDYDLDNDMTTDKSNFIDPFHFNQYLGNIIIEDLVKGKGPFSK